MTLPAVTTVFALMVSSTGKPVLAYPESPTGLLGSPLSVDFLIHAGFIWVALTAICIIVFAYRRRRKSEARGFNQIYENELDAMRKGRRD